MRRAIFFGLCFLGFADSGFASEATAEEAQRLLDVFHRYVGMPRAGQADHVRVEPQGEAYRVTIDFDELARPLAPLGFALESAESSFLVLPLEDGTWKVSDWQMPSPITIGFMEETTSLRVEGLKFDGIYDPELAAFTRFDETIGSMSTEANGPQGGGTATYGEQVITGTGSAAGEGGVDIVIRQTLDSFSAEQTVVIPSEDPATPATPPFSFSYEIDSSAVDFTFSVFKTQKVLEAWAYAVARAQESPPNIDEQEVKRLLTDLLPLFQRVDEGVTMSGLRVQSPFGAFGMKDTTFKLDFSGVVPDSGMAMSLNLSEPSFPTEIVPPWAKSLLPTELDVGFDVSGFNLDAAARHLIEVFDGTRAPPLEDADWEAATKLAMPEQGGTFTLRPGYIDGPVLDVEFEGEMALQMPRPSGTFTVTAVGLDAAIASLNGNSGDPVEAQVLGALTLAKMWGRPGGEGGMEFQFEIAEDGSVTVNDQMLKPADGAPL